MDARTSFRYRQRGTVVWAEYDGGDIAQGHLLGTVDARGGLRFHYHHLNAQGEMRAGVCESTPCLLPDGRLRMEESWQWLTDDCSAGHSVIEEA
ncbi:n-acetylglutamate synthase [Gordonibacter sp.]|uniref:n-acetylglutamate synthase n=1 Tax=Gordonibacter sp. TaxID=1968902 RepID=UPI002FC9E535